MSQSTDFDELVPEMQAWNEGNGIDIDSWIGCIGSYTHAIGYSRIFWPQFVEYDGCILISDHVDPTNYHNWKKAHNGDRQRVEQSMNHQHIVDLFINTTEVTPAQLRYLGRILTEMWKAKLHRDFPKRSFIVEFADGDCDEDFDEYYGYIISFYQETHAESPYTQFVHSA